MSIVRVLKLEFGPIVAMEHSRKARQVDQICPGVTYAAIASTIAPLVIQKDGSTLIGHLGARSSLEQLPQEMPVSNNGALSSSMQPSNYCQSLHSPSSSHDPTTTGLRVTIRFAFLDANHTRCA